MTEQERVDDALQRIGLASLIYYPGIHADEPDYAVSDDVEWCLEPLSVLSAERLESLRDLTARTIVDPTTNRERLFSALRDLPNEV